MNTYFDISGEFLFLVKQKNMSSYRAINFRVTLLLGLTEAQKIVDFSKGSF